MEKFTKGDWLIVERCNSSISIESDLTGFVVCTTTLNEKSDMHNANLIAAAPSMYKVLKTIQIEGGLSVARHKQIGKILKSARGE